MSGGWRVVAGSAPAAGPSPQDRVRQVLLPGGLLLLAVADAAVRIAADAAARSFPATAPATLAGWQQATRAFAGACHRGLVGRTLVAAVLAPPFLGYLSVGDGFLVLHRDPGGSLLVVPPEGARHGVLADRAITGVALSTDVPLDDCFDLARDPATDAGDLDRLLSPGRTMLLAVR